MSSKKVSTYKRKLTVSTATWATDVLTITFTGNHLLTTGNTISFVDPVTSTTHTVVVTVTGATIVTVPMLYRHVSTPKEIFIPSFSQTFTGVSEVETLNTSNRTFQATVTTTSGNGSAVVNILVSNDGVGWLALGTITLVSAASPVSDGFAIDAAWVYSRLNVSSITGTGAVLTVNTAGVN